MEKFSIWKMGNMFGRKGEKNKVRATAVFVPGGLPRFTYISRNRGAFEEKLKAAADNLCKLVTVTGTTKLGKTVLTKTVFPAEKAVWIDGGSCDAEDDLWAQVVEQLDLYTESQVGATTSVTYGATASLEGEANVLVAKTKGTVSPEWKQNRGSDQRYARRVSAKPAALAGLRQSNLPLIIDDFHYLDREIQSSVVRAVKAPVFGGQPVVLLAIPHRRYDAVRVEREMTGRIESLSIPPWEQSELLEIPQRGFELLNVSVPKGVLEQFAKEALGSPHLMQDFCRRLCESHDIRETVEVPLELTEISTEAVFRSVASGTSKTMFERLARGPRQRSDRKQRRLRSGETADIYLAVLLAIAKLQPGMETLEYEDIRSALRDVLAETAPQAHEVSRVLKHMAQISADDETSTPVIDWEEDDRRLHVTDPFFAFYLKWGFSAEGKIGE